MGSGPTPITSFVLDTHHMKATCFDNFDINEFANNVGRQIELEKRMKFKTRNTMEAKEELGEYDCIFLEALDGMTKEEKMKITGHVRNI